MLDVYPHCSAGRPDLAETHPHHHDPNLYVYQVLSDWGNPNHGALHGVAPRAIQALFDSVRVGGDSGTRVTCSYVEVYNDSVNDLLGARKGVPLREAAQGVVVDGLAVEEVASLRQTMALVGRGNALRVVAGMKMNARSSRGHAVLTVRTNRGDFVLDNLTTKVMLWKDTPYTYLKRQSARHAGHWVSIEMPDQTVVGSVK